MYAVFRGYQKWNTRLHLWENDEWLVGIFGNLHDAKYKVEELGMGKPFDDNGEKQITLYFGKPGNCFNHGPELKEGAPGIMEKEWFRYAEFELCERSDI